MTDNPQHDAIPELDIGLTLKQMSNIRSALVFALGFSVMTALMTGIFTWLIPIRLSQFVVAMPVFAAVVSLSILLALVVPRRVYYIFILASMAMPLFFEDLSIGLGFMKLYPADFMFLYSVALLTGDYLFIRSIPSRKIGFNKFVIVFFLVGLVGVFLGMKYGNRFDKVFGDYRRSFFYLANYFVSLYMIRNVHELRLMVRTLLVGALLTIPVGLVQLAMGKGYVRSPIDAAHVLSWMQCTFLSFGIFYAVAHLMYRPQHRPRRWITIAMLGILMTIAANFRSNWLGLALGFGGMFLFLPPRLKVRAGVAGVCAALIVALGLGAMWDQKIFENRTLGAEIAKKADLKSTNVDINVIWRYQSYQAAFRKIEQHPILGCGLGTYLTFHIPTSRGTQTLALNHNVHNSFLWLIMSLGIPGITALLAMHGYYLWAIRRYLLRSKWDYGRIVVMACGAYYLSAMTATFFQNYLEQAVTVTIFGCVCAVTMLAIHYTPRKYYS